MAYEYFISYRRDHYGKALSGNIYNILIDCGKTVFWDKKSIHNGDWKPQIADALFQAKQFIVLITDVFFKETTVEDLNNDNYPIKEKPNDWFFYEINLALKSNIVVTPVVYDETLFKNIQSGKLQDKFAEAILKYDLPTDFYDQFKACCNDKQKLRGDDEHFTEDFLNHFQLEKKSQLEGDTQVTFIGNTITNVITGATFNGPVTF